MVAKGDDDEIPRSRAPGSEMPSSEGREDEDVSLTAGHEKEEELIEEDDQDPEFVVEELEDDSEDDDDDEEAEDDEEGGAGQGWDGAAGPGDQNDCNLSLGPGATECMEEGLPSTADEVEWRSSDDEEDEGKDDDEDEGAREEEAAGDEVCLSASSGIETGRETRFWEGGQEGLWETTTKVAEERKNEIGRGRTRVGLGRK